MISFKNLIELPDKPKKVKYDKTIYTFSIDYGSYLDEYSNFLEDEIWFLDMNDKNIEVLND